MANTINICSLPEETDIIATNSKLYSCVCTLNFEITVTSILLVAMHIPCMAGILHAVLCLVMQTMLMQACAAQQYTVQDCSVLQSSTLACRL